MMGQAGGDSGRGQLGGPFARPNTSAPSAAHHVVWGSVEVSSSSKDPYSSEDVRSDHSAPSEQSGSIKGSGAVAADTSQVAHGSRPLARNPRSKTYPREILFQKEDSSGNEVTVSDSSPHVEVLAHRLQAATGSTRNYLAMPHQASTSSTSGYLAMPPHEGQPEQPLQSERPEFQWSGEQMGPSNHGTEAEEENHLRQLQQQLQRQPAQSVSPQRLAQVPRGPDGELTSVGSIGHGSRTCEVCMFMNSPSGCMTGLNCSYCHMPHARAVAKAKSRPCKGKRIRYMRLITRLNDMIQEDPSNFTMDNVELPPSIASSEIMKAKIFEVARTFLQQAGAQRGAQENLDFMSAPAVTTPAAAPSRSTLSL